MTGVQTCALPISNFIFTGDLNLSPNAKSIRLIEKELKHCGPDYKEPTWTTKPFSFMGFEETKLKWRLDYIFASKDVKIINSKIIKTRYSDHLPIILEIERSTFVTLRDVAFSTILIAKISIS